MTRKFVSKQATILKEEDSDLLAQTCRICREGVKVGDCVLIKRYQIRGNKIVQRILHPDCLDGMSVDDPFSGIRWANSDKDGLNNE